MQLHLVSKRDLNPHHYSDTCSILLEIMVKARTLLLRFTLVLACLPFVTSAEGQSYLVDSADIPIGATSKEVENSLFASPVDPNVLLLANIRAGDPKKIAAWVSIDGGSNWTEQGFLDAGFDPAVAIGRIGGPDGRVFVNYTKDQAEEVDVRYKDTGTTWTLQPVDIAPMIVNDKNHFWIDNNPTGMYSNRLYCAWTLTPSSIVLRSSIDNGNNWGPQVPVNEPANGAHLGVNLQVAPVNGQGVANVYATWTQMNGLSMDTPPSNIAFRWSNNGGSSWSSSITGQYIQNTGPTGGAGLVGYLSLPEKSMRTPVFPSMTVDESTGDIFISFSDLSGASEDADIFLLKSTDEGQTWTGLGGVRKRVNPDDQQDQWSPWIAWDECTGAIVIVYFDSRDFPNTDQVNTYLSYSFDGGSQWGDIRISDVAWDGDPDDSFAGDYIGLDTAAGTAFPVWSDDRDQANVHKPFISPINLWGVVQPTVSASFSNVPGGMIDVTAEWMTSVTVAAPGDELVLTSPSQQHYTSPVCTTCSSDGISHSLTLSVPCELGTWSYSVRSSGSKCSTKRQSSSRTFKVKHCLN